MGRYLLRRALSSSIVLATSLILVFLSIRILPGDPVLARLGAATKVTPEALEALREEAGLDRPLLAQLFSWLSDALRGDLGVSYISQFPVTQLIGERLPVTFELTFFIIVLSCIFALILAPLSILKPGGILDRFISTMTSIGLSIPGFVVGIIFILIFSLTLQWLPSLGFVPIKENIGQNLQLMIIPSFKRDYAIIQGVSLVIISLFILTTLCFDILCGLVDPRLRVAKDRQNEI